MAITNAERDALVSALMEVFFEDYNNLARLLAILELRFPNTAWRSRFVTIAPSFAPYLASGLSISWFTSEIGRLADIYKAV